MCFIRYTGCVARFTGELLRREDEWKFVVRNEVKKEHVPVYIHVQSATNVQQRTTITLNVELDP